MRKYVFIFLYLVLVVRVWSQEQITLKYNPAEPTIAEMIKPNDIPVNESTGKIFPSIPLYTLTAGDIQLPISVTYNGNGIKVGQSPGILGYNWQLNYGGKVTRNLRGEADEERDFINRDFHYYDSLRNINPSLYPQDNTPFYQALLHLTNSTAVDTEKDIFQFELLGYSGSFIIFPLERNGTKTIYEGRIIKGEQAVKIRYYVDFNDSINNRTFYITLPNGITGIYGGSGYVTRLTKITPPIDMSHPSERKVLPPSVFYIKKIEDKKNNFINFKYFTNELIQNDIKLVEKYYSTCDCGENSQYSARTDVEINDNSSEDGDNENDDQDEDNINNPDEDTFINQPSSGNDSDDNSGGGMGGNNQSTSYNDCFHEMMQTLDFSGKKKILESITTSDQDSISFHYTNVGVLYKISLYHFRNPFLYIGFGRYQDTPNFLHKIIFENHDKFNRQRYYYKFEYYEPDKFPSDATENFKAIDLWGYYNGHDENTSLVNVFNPSILCRFQEDPSDYVYNRAPDLESSQYGALKRIYFPTGGYKEFEYELATSNDPAIISTRTSLHIDVSLDTNLTLENLGSFFDSLSTSYIDTLASRYYGIDYVDFNTYDMHNINSSILNLQISGQSSSRMMASLSVILVNKTNNTNELFGASINLLGNNNSNDDNENDSNSTYNDSYNTSNPRNIHNIDNMYRTFHPNIGRNKEYRLIALILPYDCSGNCSALGSANLSFQFTKRDTLSSKLPGLRIKRIKTYKDSLSEPIIKRFYYNKLSDYSNNYFIQGESYDRTYYNGVTQIKIDANSSPNICICPTQIISSESLDDYLLDDTHKRLYPYVTISLGGDHFEQGGIEKHYHVEPGNFYDKLIGNMVYAHYGGNEAWMNGTLTREIYFDKNLDTIKTVEHFYHIDTSKSIRTYNYIIEKKVSGEAILGDIIPLNHIYNIAKYTTDAWWISKDSTVTTEYFPTGKVVTWTKNYYDSHYPGIPDRVRTSDSKGNILESRTYYPGTALTGLDFHSDEDRQLADTLRQMHRLTSVLQQEQYLNGNLLSASRIGYHRWNPSHNPFLPKIIEPDSIWQKKQGMNDWDLQTIAYRYDDKGHLLEASKGERGTHVFFLYGYHNTKIIAVLNFVPCLVEGQFDCDLKNNNIIQQAISHAITKSNLDDELGTEDSERELRQALSDLHQAVYNLHSDNYRVISAYTYDPPIGMTGKMDEKGDWSTYHYDLLGRLQYIKDKDGNIRKEYQYKYIQSDY